MYHLTCNTCGKLVNDKTYHQILLRGPRETPHLNSSYLTALFRNSWKHMRLRQKKPESLDSWLLLRYLQAKAQLMLDMKSQRLPSKCHPLLIVTCFLLKWFWGTCLCVSSKQSGLLSVCRCTWMVSTTVLRVYVMYSKPRNEYILYIHIEQSVRSNKTVAQFQVSWLHQCDDIWLPWNLGNLHRTQQPFVPGFWGFWRSHLFQHCMTVFFSPVFRSNYICSSCSGILISVSVFRTMPWGTGGTTVLLLKN